MTYNVFGGMLMFILYSTTTSSITSSTHALQSLTRFYQRHTSSLPLTATLILAAYTEVGHVHARVLLTHCCGTCITLALFSIQIRQHVCCYAVVRQMNLTYCDGLTSSDGSQLVYGAESRPHDIDDG